MSTRKLRELLRSSKSTNKSNSNNTSDTSDTSDTLDTSDILYNDNIDYENTKQVTYYSTDKNDFVTSRVPKHMTISSNLSLNSNDSKYTSNSYDTFFDIVDNYASDLDDLLSSYSINDRYNSTVSDNLDVSYDKNDSDDQNNSYNLDVSYDLNDLNDFDDSYDSDESDVSNIFKQKYNRNNPRSSIISYVSDDSDNSNDSDDSDISNIFKSSSLSSL